jgi:hypothetical protein
MIINLRDARALLLALVLLAAGFLLVVKGMLVGEWPLVTAGLALWVAAVSGLALRLERAA